MFGILQGEVPAEHLEGVNDFINDRVDHGFYVPQAIATPGGPRLILEQRACYMVEADLRVGLTMTIDSIVQRYMKEMEIVGQAVVVESQFLSNPVGGGVELHTDDFKATIQYPRHIISMTYFNSDFVGGELFFPKSNVRITPRPGLVAVFDSRNPHTVAPLIQGRRNAMQRSYTIFK